MALNIEYQLRPSYSNFSGGTIRLDDIRTVDIAAMLAAGSGTIIADSSDGVLVGALDAYPALIRSGETEDPPLPIFSTTQLKVRGEGEKLVDLEGASANMAVATNENGDLVLVPFATPEEVALKADQTAVEEALGSVVSGDDVDGTLPDASVPLAKLEEPVAAGAELGTPEDGDRPIYDSTASTWRAARPSVIELGEMNTADVAAAYSRALTRFPAQGGTVVLPPDANLHGVQVTPRSGIKVQGHGPQGASVLRSSENMAGDQALIGQPTDDLVGFVVDGVTFKGGASTPTEQYATIDGMLVPRPRRATRTFGAGAKTGIGIAGDLIAGESRPLVRDVAVRNSWFANFEGLPALFRGVRGVTETQNLHSYNTLDFGWTYCENVVSTNMSSRWSGDNGFSYSRGNQRMSLGNHLAYGSMYAGLWIAGFAGEVGPTDFMAGPIVVVGAGHYGLDMHYAPIGGRVDLYVNHVWRATDEEIAAGSGVVDQVGCGFVISGNPDLVASPTTRARELAIRGTLRNCQRGGGLIRGATNVTVDVDVVNPGTQYLADGTTEIATLTDSTGAANKRNQNFGIAVDPAYASSVDKLRIRHLEVRDERATPVAQYPLVVGAGVTNAKIRDVTAEGTAFAPYAGVAQNAGNTNVLGNDEAGKRVDTGSIAAGSWGAVQKVTEAANAVHSYAQANATGGTKTFTFRGQTTTALDQAAGQATVQAALEALSTIGTGNVVVLGSSTAFTITFQGTLAAQPIELMKVTSSLTGTGVTATMTHTEAGGASTAYYRDVTVAFAKGTFTATPQVLLSIDSGSTGCWVEKSVVSANGFTARMQSLRASCPAPVTTVWRAVG